MLNLQARRSSTNPSAVPLRAAETARVKADGAQVEVPVRSGWASSLTRGVRGFVHRVADRARVVGRQAPVIAAVTLALSFGAAGGAMAQTAGAPLDGAAVVASQVEAPAGDATYVVRPGDNLERIAQRFGTTVDALVELNDIRYQNLIYPKQVLRLPGDARTEGPGAHTYVVKPGDSVERIAERLGISPQALLDANHLPNPDVILPDQVLAVPAQVPQSAVDAAMQRPQGSPLVEATPQREAPSTYTVRPGDFLERISRRVGVSVQRLAELNDLSPPYVIHPQQVLTLRPEASGPMVEAPRIESPRIEPAPTRPAHQTPARPTERPGEVAAPGVDTPPAVHADATVRPRPRPDDLSIVDRAAAGIAHLSAADRAVFLEAKPRVHWGMNGPNVELVQAQLTRLGYAIGTVDGDYGRLTRSAVRAFQAFNGLDADGVVGPSTWDALASADAVRMPTDGAYPVKDVYRPYTADAYRLFLRAARDEGLPLSWAIADSLHKLIDEESDGEVGRPNYTYGWRSRDPDQWASVHEELRRGRITARSSATGIGQLLLGNVEIHYPSGRAGIDVPLEEARGMLSYIEARHTNPDRAWSRYNLLHEGY